MAYLPCDGVCKMCVSVAVFVMSICSTMYIMLCLNVFGCLCPVCVSVSVCQSVYEYVYFYLLGSVTLYSALRL